jgi:hypothetical protein
MVVVVCEGVVNGREIEVVVRGYVLRMLTFVDGTGGDMEHTDTSAVDSRLTAERILGRDDLGHGCDCSRIDKRFAFSIPAVLGGARGGGVRAGCWKGAAAFHLRKPAARCAREQDRGGGRGAAWVGGRALTSPSGRDSSAVLSRSLSPTARETRVLS